jgi:hypothetical protein
VDESALQDQIDRDPDAALATIARMTRATDVALRARAKQLAARLFLDLARDHRSVGRGIGRIASVRFQPDGELDVEASIDVLIDAAARRSAVDADSLRSRAWVAPSTAWCLLVDRSGSMHGEPVATAAMAAASVALRGASAVR